MKPVFYLKAWNESLKWLEDYSGLLFRKLSL